MLTPTPRSVTACNLYDTGLFATIFDALTLVPLYTEKSRHTTTLFSNRSDKIRTCGPHVPNVVLYHLSHTPMCSPLFGTAIVIIMAAFRKSKQKILILIGTESSRIRGPILDWNTEAERNSDGKKPFLFPYHLRRTGRLLRDLQDHPLCLFCRDADMDGHLRFIDRF